MLVTVVYQNLFGSQPLKRNDLVERHLLLNPTKQYGDIFVIEVFLTI